ncbi:hypothetical protein L210DRAFT_3500764 [Boletus edulis BED1]|uniref:Uncharacterized protein n=1 Tax=Boletus edulis BED1 TaxID=1328754 RepID=A0AAD4C579_BOLED|nr:hypothetical protein L210DRAFT_3500764 [Boletus edulis BED1]
MSVALLKGASTLHTWYAGASTAKWKALEQSRGFAETSTARPNDSSADVTPRGRCIDYKRLHRHNPLDENWLWQKANGACSGIIPSSPVTPVSSKLWGAWKKGVPPKPTTLLSESWG